ncbi:hypothetical protein EC973_001828 [Apophysomyces ossiformis]|uniref:Tyr recombinase domain-containing protein n=1 Tax=Apophysomyces ossiformis TaxID=679940 RepID=A0A8H7EM37_9FUNG|nr:hypothetical protein EC973_001828 [Apophysomyces ossiformis]
MTGFLRPSDLYRIALTKCTIDENGCCGIRRCLWNTDCTSSLNQRSITENEDKVTLPYRSYYTYLYHTPIAEKNERRGGRRIVKTILVRPHRSQPALCPVAAFQALRDHPAAQSRPQDNLLVNSRDPFTPLEATTISSWLRQIVSLSTNLKPLPTGRSLASDLALVRGVPVDDVVTLGNWSSHTVFDKYYRRQRLQAHDITAVML